MNYILYFGVTVYLFLTTTVAAHIGVVQVGTASTLVIVMLSLYKMTRYNINNLISNFKIEFCIIIFSLIVLILKLILSDIDGAKNIIFFLTIPAILSVLLLTQNVKRKNVVKNIILLFYVAECLLAIYERSYNINFFPYEEVSELISIEESGFRSSAFLGHPLQNALCVSVIMGFLLVSEMKLIIKMCFVVLGYMALLCFNAKGAILVWTILIPIYLVKVGLSKNRKELLSFKMVIFFIISSYFIFTLIVTQNFGDRLFQGILLDGSALARIEVFGAFSYLNSADFWIGNSQNYILVMNKLGAGGVENSYIVIILYYGVVLASILFALLFFWIKRFLNNISLNEKIIIITSFILVGSMNNSLATSVSLMFFILCAGSFLVNNKFKIMVNT